MVLSSNGSKPQNAFLSQSLPYTSTDYQANVVNTNAVSRPLVLKKQGRDINSSVKSNR